MSVKVMGVVFSSALPPTDRLVALALADYAHDDGTRIYPAVATVAQKVGLGTTATRSAIRRLEHGGVLECISPGGGRAKATEYRFRPEWLNATLSEGFTNAPNPTDSGPKPNASEPETQRISTDTQRLGVAEPLEPLKTEPLGTVKALASRSRPRDELFEFLAFVETGSPYDPSRSLPANLRGRINAAASQARKAGFEIPDLTEALEGWASAMPEHTRVTANGLVTNAYRCINAFHGAAFAPRESDSIRRLREAMGTP